MYTMLATLALLPLLVAGALAAPCRDSFSPECSKNGLYNASLKTCACAAPWAGPKCAWITHPGMTCDANTNMCQCASATPVLDMASNACRSRQASDCAGTDAPVLDGTTKECRARQPSDCAGTDAPVLDGTTKECRARQPSDCTGNMPVLDGTTKECRVRKDSDCAGTDAPVLDGTTKECRARQPSDCTGNMPVLDGITKECRARQDSDCAGTPMPILDGGACRARTASDCTGTVKPVFNSGSGECQASKACPIDPSSFHHAGKMGACTGTELAVGKTCLPTCDTGLTGAGSVSCEADKPLENSFVCSAAFQMDLAGVTDANWKDDEKIVEAFESALVKFLPEGTGREDILESAMKDGKVIFKLRVTKDGATETKIGEVMAAAVSEGTFTTAMQQSLESESVTSVDPKEVSASRVQVVQPADGPSGGDADDSSNDGSPPSDNGNDANPMSYVIPLVCVAVVLVVLAIVVKKRVLPSFNKNRGNKRASLGASNELTLEQGTSDVANPLESGPAVAVFVGGDK